MNRLDYINEFAATMQKNHPREEKRRIEDYLDTFANVPPTLKKIAKCPFIAADYRYKEYVLYKHCQYEEAILSGTNSLRRSPPYSESAALAYATRSGALHKLKLYKECMLDINRALELPCPEDLRRYLCSFKELVAELIAKQNLTNSNAVGINDLKYAYEENSKLRGVSLGIDIEDDPRSGRKVIAKMPFKVGDVLMIQSPYLPVITIEEYLTHCHHCMKKTFCLIPCDQCCYELYCSEECRTRAYEKYHRTECAIQFTLINSFPIDVQGLLCQLRCLNILTEQGANLESLYEDIKKMENNFDPENLKDGEENFYGNPKKAFLSLLSNKKIKPDLKQVKLNSRPIFEATYIVTLLKNHTKFFKKNSDIPLVAEMLVKLSTIYAKTYFPILYFGKPEIKARATYPMISLANHACINNTVTYIDSEGKIVLRASQNIRPGEEILCGYRLLLIFEETIHRSGKILQCNRQCQRCDKIYSYPPEKMQHVKMDRKLRATLQKNPYDVKALWKLIGDIHGKHQRYTLQALMVKSMLVNAYEGHCDYTIGMSGLRLVGIL